MKEFIDEIIDFWKGDKWSKWVIVVSMLFSLMLINISETHTSGTSGWTYILINGLLFFFGFPAIYINVFYRGITNSTKKKVWEIIQEVENANKIIFKKEDWENLRKIDSCNLPESVNKLILVYSIFNEKIEKIIKLRTNKTYVITLLIIIVCYYVFKPNLHFPFHGTPHDFN